MYRTIRPIVQRYNNVILTFAYYDRRLGARSAALGFSSRGAFGRHRRASGTVVRLTARRHDSLAWLLPWRLATDAAGAWDTPSTLIRPASTRDRR